MDQVELTSLSSPPEIEVNDFELENEKHVVGLLFAASKGDLEGIKRMVKGKQVNVNAGDYDMRTALHVASSEGHIEVVQFLVSQGANVNAVDRFGNAPIDDSIRQGHQGVTNALVDLGAEKPSAAFELELISAASRGDADTVRRLLNNTVNPNCADYDLRTPLHLAAANHNEKIVRMLLAAGAKVGAEDRWGSTPLSDAMRSGVRLGEDLVVEILREAATKVGLIQHTIPFYRDPQILFFILVEAAILILHACFSTYLNDSPNLERYPMFQDVNVMIFIGFGFLMTFLRKYGYSSVGFNFAIAAFTLQWYPLLNTFWHNVFNQSWTTPVYMDVGMLISSEFCAGAVLITYGALLGKTSLTQMMFIALAEPFFYALNEAISFKLDIADVGGSMVIHTFGAFFGLAASRVLTPAKARGPSDNAAVYHSDLFSMIGTVFLWIFWPSFNAAFTDGDAQTRAIVNTLLSLTASTVVAFLMSYWIRGHNKLFMVDIQNATLAGGVSMGAAANMVLEPATALAIGIVAGCVSVFGFAVLQARLERMIGLHDTCGVLNLHGMPGVLGGTWSAIAAAFASAALYGSSFLVIFPAMDPSGIARTAQWQGAWQFIYLLITLGIAITSGTIVGFVARLPLFQSPKTFFLDSEEWDVPELERPYYFDKRGENSHTSDDLNEGKKMEKTMLGSHNGDLDVRLSNIEAVVKRLQSNTTKTVRGTLAVRNGGSDQTGLSLNDLNAKLDKVLNKLA